ncbi:hypothetical protein J1N35_037459, partial [Gossypium stocksii]
ERQRANHTKEIQKLKLRRINAYLNKINKPAFKTIQASSFSANYCASLGFFPSAAC